MTNLPIEPLSRNLMRPLILAKRVSSLPRPTFRPGLTRVPALAHDDGAAGDDLSAESLEA